MHYILYVQAERTITAVCAQVSHKKTTSREQTKHTTAQKRATLDVSSDTYYHVVENTVRKYVAPAGYTVTRISRLQIPYFNIECRAQQKDVGALPETAFKITQKIYNDLFKMTFLRLAIFFNGQMKFCPSLILSMTVHRQAPALIFNLTWLKSTEPNPLQKT